LRRRRLEADRVCSTLYTAIYYAVVRAAAAGEAMMSMRSRPVRAAAAAACLGLAMSLAAEGAPQAKITVFAAASLKEALDTQVARFETGRADKVVVSYGGSNALARQIEAGAPADVFLSADVDWMDYLQARGLIVPATRVDLLANRLVLIAPAASTLALKIAPGFALASALGSGRLALANPDSVPAGRYAKAALSALKVWSSVAGRTARTENVRAALTLVARGEAPCGIVYSTDALAEPRVRVLDTFPARTHPPIVYPAVVVARSDVPAEAKAFVAYLASEPALATWRRYGFRPLERATP
jgi:molybdate transport system substrate-binding protein